MVFKTLLIVLVFAVLLEDSASIKKTVEEEREDREIAEAVNKTLAEEEKRREEDEKKKKLDQEESKKKDRDGKNKKEDQDKKKDMEDKSEACPPANTSCPIVEPCPKVKECGPCEVCEPPGDCPPEKEYGPCEPSEDCPPVKECGPCPPIYCHPCPVSNITETAPSICQCPEGSGVMTVPVAVAVGVVATLLATGVAALIGILLRYVSPIASGFIFVATIIIIWYLCSHYPETARELGGRVASLLREAAVALGHRVMETIRHRDQVCSPAKPMFFFRMSSKFHFVKFALRFSL
jgi:hypothetical protein